MERGMAVKDQKQQLNIRPQSRLGDVGTLFVAQMRRVLASSWYGEQGDDPTSRPAGQILHSQGKLQPSNPVCEVLVYSSLSGI